MRALRDGVGTSRDLGIGDLDRLGYAVVEGLLAAPRCDELIAELPPVEGSGTRSLLSMEVFRHAIEPLRTHPVLEPHLAGLLAVQCILFRKSSDHNWALRLHRDEVLPVSGRGPWRDAGVKEGMPCVRPPREFMDRCLALRIQLDGAPVEDVSVVPGSHRDRDRHARGEAIPVSVGKGGALLMRPTLVHASAKLPYTGARRVLHYVFAPADLPAGYTWSLPAPVA